MLSPDTPPLTVPPAPSTGPRSPAGRLGRSTGCCPGDPIAAWRSPGRCFLGSLGRAGGGTLICGAGAFACLSNPQLLGTCCGDGDAATGPGVGWAAPAQGFPSRAWALSPHFLLLWGLCQRHSTVGPASAPPPPPEESRFASSTRDKGAQSQGPGPRAEHTGVCASSRACRHRHATCTHTWTQHTDPCEHAYARRGMRVCCAQGCTCLLCLWTWV